MTIANNSIEKQLIIYGCQTVIPESQANEMSKWLRSGVDWKFVLNVAHGNSVLPLLSWNLRNRFGELLPDEINVLLENEFQRHLRTNLFLTGRMLELLKDLRIKGIDAVPFKGPLLSLQAYGDPALRKYGDLDLLVQPIDFKKAAEIIGEHGFEPLTSVSWLEKTNWYISRKKDIYFANQDRSVIVELHWKLSGSHFGLPREMNGLWKRLETVDVAGTAVPSLSYYDLLIYLCLHGSRHSWERFQWVCDIHELIRSNADLDWNLLFEKAKRFGCENVVALSLRLIHEFFGFNVPGPDWKKIKGDPIYDEIVIEIRERLFSGSIRSVEISERYYYHLRLRERIFDRWKLHYHYLTWNLRIIFTPNELDKSVLHFPRILYPLYYLTRPLRLLFSRVLR